MPDAPPTAPWTEEKVRALLLHSGDIISLLDAQGRLVYNSPAAERISGFSALELAGIDTFQLIHPDDREAVGRAFAEVLATPGAVRSVEYRYRTKAGGWTWMEAVASNQLDNPEVRGVVANSRDVSGRKQAEEERARLEAQLTHSQRMESLGTLAGGIAHDFNNLLTALCAHVDLASDAAGQEEVRAELAGARAAIQQAAALTRQLLAFARRQPVRPAALDCGAVLLGLRLLLARLLGGRIRVRIEVPDEPLWVFVDPGQLEQVVVNLATNARDAMPEGGDLLLELSAEPGGRGAALLRVTDSGAGMPAEVLARAFEPFFTTKELGRGSGLGLAVTHGIVAQAGGEIRLESSPGRGTTALIRLPRVAAPAPAPVPRPPPAHAAARPGERLLLADDDEAVRTVTRRLLARCGWEVDEARDGREAVERVRAAPGAHAAVVLDLRMPVLGGRDAARLLESIAPALPIVFVSGYAEDADAGVLQKPFEAGALAARVREAIDRGAERAGAARPA